MVKRDLSKQRLIFAGAITLMIFALGISLGLIVDYERLYYSERGNNVQELNYNSLQLQYLYLAQQGDGENVCPILRAALQNSIEELGFSLEEYERYSKNTIFEENKYNYLQRKYLQDNIRYWLFSTRLQGECESDVTNVLYFYSDEDCPTCSNQGTVLTYYKNKLEDQLLVFPINIDLATEEQFLEILVLSYNITTTPTLIVNEGKYEGVINKETLATVICQESKNKEKCLV